MTCKIAYTEKLLTKISRKKKGQMERSDEKKNCWTNFVCVGIKKSDKANYLQQKETEPLLQDAVIFIFIIYYIVCKATWYFYEKVSLKIWNSISKPFSKMISPKTQIHDTKSSGRNMKIKIKQKRKVKQENS